MQYGNCKKVFWEGFKDGIPIGLGYLAVSFALGISAKGIGMDALQGFVMSLFNLASAGEYAGIMAIGSKATYIGTVLIIFVANLRYLLMSCALSQRLDPDMPLRHRLLVGFGLTDEIFSITIARPGYVHPFYVYGALLAAAPAWAAGTSLGIIAGNILPTRVVSALNVALFGMFIAVIIPESKKNKVVLGLVLVSFSASYILSRVALFSSISSGTRVIILTVLISLAGAILFPVKEDDHAE